MRLNIYRTHPGWATSDEIEFAMTFFQPDTFCPPVLHHDLSLIAPSVKPTCTDVQRFVALREGHWIGIEVVCNSEERTCRAVFLQVPPRDQQFWHDFALALSFHLDFAQLSSLIQIGPDLECAAGSFFIGGLWLTYIYLTRFMCHTRSVKSLMLSLMNPIKHGEVLEHPLCSEPLQRTFAGYSWLLVAFIFFSHVPPCHLGEWKGKPVQMRRCSLLILGSLKTLGSPRRSLLNRASGRISNFSQIILSLPKTRHPCPLSRNNNSPQTVEGLHSYPREIEPKEPCALLLPMIDPTDPLAKLSNLSGPCEVIVFDPALNQEYKRQVHLLVITPEVHFALPAPAITLTLAAVCEIVLECDARLTTKDVFQSFYDNPLARFKVQLKAIWGHAAIYGYRAVQEHSKERHDVIHQCLLKVQQKHRIPLLSASGTGDLVVRDFIPKGEQVQDLSIIPRFWAIDRANKADLLKAASSIAGYRGIAVTKRGLAPRFATDSLATARDLLLPQDDRICSINKAMIPKVNMDSLGWPSEILAKDIVSAVHQATKVACIPTRSFRRAGVCAWTLSFEKLPTVTKFSVQVNGKTFEVLLTPVIYKAPSKGKGKGKNAKGQTNGGPEQVPPKSSVSKEIHNERIDRLEEQVGRLEQKHETLSEKVDHQFSQVGDQLHQILQCVQPRHREHGDTPPPVKHHRAA